MPPVDFVLPPKSGCYRLNKHPSLAFPLFFFLFFFFPVRELPKNCHDYFGKEPIWKVMQMDCLAECSYQWHMLVARNIKSLQGPCESRVRNLEAAVMYFLIPGRLNFWSFFCRLLGRLKKKHVTRYIRDNHQKIWWLDVQLHVWIFFQNNYVTV